MGLDNGVDGTRIGSWFDIAVCERHDVTGLVYSWRWCFRSREGCRDVFPTGRSGLKVSRVECETSVGFVNAVSNSFTTLQTKDVVEVAARY